VTAAGLKDQKMKSRQRRSLSIILISILILACAPLFSPGVATLDPNQINTIIAGTAAAAATQTALLTPATWTAVPTIFPTATVAESPTPTETFIFLVFSPTFTATASQTQPATQNYDCRVVEQSPLNGTVLNRRTDFQAKWIVVNTGFRTWPANDSDYLYVGGADMHDKRGYDLNVSVNPGETATLVVNMTTPSQRGTYNTTWQLRVANVEFCRLRLSIEVQ
jgi:hypothetical protein